MSTSPAPQSPQNAIVRRDLAETSRLLLNLSGIYLSAPTNYSKNCNVVDLCSTHDLYQPQAYSEWGELRCIGLGGSVWPYNWKDSTDNETCLGKLDVRLGVYRSVCRGEGADLRDIELLSEWVLDNICARYETSNQSVLLEYQAPSSHEEVVYYDEVVDDWLLYEVHPPGPRKGDPLKDPRLWRFPSTKSDFTACLINDVPWLVFECFQVDGDVEVTACAAITPEHILSIEFSVNEAKESLFDHSLGMDEIVQTDIRTYMSNVFVTYSSYAKLSERPKMGETDGMG